MNKEYIIVLDKLVFIHKYISFDIFDTYTTLILK